MKKGLFLLLSMTFSYLSMAQVPNSFSYQMVIRNGNNELVANTTVGIRIGLLGGNAADTVWYEEEHKVKTNLNGLAYITIGKGNILKGGISTIDWTRGPFFIKSETDPTGGTNYSLIIVSQMLSVPYAIYAKTAEKLSTPVTESDPLFNKSVAKGITSEDTARWSKKEIYDGNSGGGITNESDPVFSNSVAKGIRSVDTASWNNKLNLRDTMNLLRPYLRASDTASLSNRLNQKVDLQQFNTNTLTLDGKVNIVDTAELLANYRTGINAKVNIADTLNMLVPYLRDTDTTAMLANYLTGINTKVNISDTINMLIPYLRDADTTAMLANYRTGINARVNIIDTASMLQPYLRDADTTSMLLPYLRNADTILLDLENRFTSKVNITDTAAMLANYRTGIYAKVNILDTATMLQPYLRDADTTIMLSPYLMNADTTAMLANYFTVINSKVNISDTLNMLQPYLRDVDTTNMLSPYLLDADTTVMLVNYQTGINSKVNILDTASMLQPYLRDADTTSMLLPYLLDADTTAMLANYRTGINAKVNILDTASMLQPYLRDADTTSMLSSYLRDADTTAMLNNYRTGIYAKVNILDTASMLQPYLRDADTTSMLSSYLRDADTTAMLNNYRTGIYAKVNILDTASMLQPYLRDVDTTSMLSSYLRRADTTMILTPYLRDADTTSMLMPYLRDADTTNMLMPYLLDADTSNMLSNYRAGLNAKAPINNPTFTGTVYGITQAMVGLPNVDNTSDVNKSISTATQTALNLKLNISDTAAMLLNYRNNGSGLPTSGNSLGDMLYWNGSAWVKISAGSAGKVLKINGGIPEWANADFNCGLATTDVDNNTYNTVQIGQQCWMKENLKTSRYRNGDLIPVVVYSAWGVLTTGGRDWYSGDSTAYEYPYGNLYNWYAVGDSRGLCPTGWHIPTDAEWTILTTNLGGESVAGGRLKSTSSIYWGSTNTNADNLTGFSALPGGERSTGGTNVNNGSAASFWSATDNGSNAWFRYLRFSDGMMTRGSFGKTYGASVRCLKD